MTNALTTRRDYFLPRAAHRSEYSRLNKYLNYLHTKGSSWLYPDLPGWRDFLLSRNIQPQTVSTYLSSVRGRYQKILKDNTFHDFVLDGLRHANPDASKADIKAMKDEMLLRFHNAIDAENSKVDVTTVQDVDESQYTRLTRSQADDLIEAPISLWKANKILESVALRDRAMIALALCTGLRADELTALKVEDLTAQYGGVLALKVTKGKGNKQRLVPYGDLIWCLDFVNEWLDFIGRKEGYVFSKIAKGGKIHKSRLNPQAFNDDVLARYPLEYVGKIDAHDMRRTYAKLQYDAGMDILAIKQNLGHEKLETTEGYIGARDADERKGRKY